MITWGISANSHNAALAVFEDSKLLFASDSERFSKIKNDPNLNQDLVDYARMIGGSPDLVCWYEKPWLKTLRQFFAGQGLQDNNVKRYLEKYEITAPIKTFKHHFTHAANAYFTSPYDSACVIIIDAIGEFETLTIWKGEGKTLRKIYSSLYPDSLGLFYSAMTQRCGLKPNEEEYILMGMAAYGNRKRLYKDMIEDFIAFPHIESYNPIMLKKNLHRGCNWWRTDLQSDQDRFDIAAATQYAYEQSFIRILQMAKGLISSDNLIIGGGCALNCSANPIAFDYFDNVYIPPAPGDNGSSIGAVLAYQKNHLEEFTPYLGTNITGKASNEQIVDYLVKNNICGVARGRAEFGPRALGNRSLLADPRDPDIKRKINEIKQREQFRPFAPAILEEFADQYFFMPVEKTPFMQFTVQCRRPDLFPAIVHKDGTSRVQTVGKRDNPEFRKLLEIWYARTGCPMLLNTSLNIKGQPMINDIIDAFEWSKTYGLPVFN